MPRLKNKKDSLKYQVIAPSGANADSLPRLKLNLRLFRGNEIAMGPGKADLLEAIESTGSISAAGKSMEMSYRRAWVLVDEMNRCFKSPLVETAKGGSHGGGARLTPFGHDVLDRYRQLLGATRQVANAYLDLFKDLLAETDNEAAPEAGEKSAQLREPQG